MSIAFQGLQEDSYRIGDLQALRYNPKQEPFFDGWLGQLYGLLNDSRIVETIFGGNPPSTFDGIVGYLATKPIVVMGEWYESHFQNEDGNVSFRVAGIAFPIITCGSPQTEVSAFCGFGFLKHIWGKPELPVLAMLGLTYLFQEFKLKSIHGTRYQENVLAARFMRQFGMRDIGTIPDYQLRDGKLVPAVVSTLSRTDFEKYVEEFLVQQYRESLHTEHFEIEHVQVDTDMKFETKPDPAPVKVEEVPQLSLSWLDVK